ncbi:MAG: bacillithiol biosynthesis deacetylase BshB1 [Cytophagaceae bacterium]|nr:bacillithiol biosynthesis deacetylase BshB1 [Cytophagaceae bacterium]MDW8456971.1 bacillithiol biosynthesis deacetylase BshB1 [Cytophagaceae bacterium]
MKLDVLVISSHPDDAELSCAGTILSLTSVGKKVGIVDLTKGELGTRGDVETRMHEAAEASKVLGLSIRGNMGFPDGFFENTKEYILELVKIIRVYQPDIVLANALNDRHPDHAMGASLASRACFLSGLRKIETGQEPWRPTRVYHYVQDRLVIPSFVVDITPYWENKWKAIQCYKSQFHNAAASPHEPETYISTPLYGEYIRARAIELGHSIGVMYGEGFVHATPIGIKNILDLI